MRPSEGKVDAIVYDFLDEHDGLLRHQFKQRKSVYHQLGMREEK